MTRPPGHGGITPRKPISFAMAYETIIFVAFYAEGPFTADDSGVGHARNRGPCPGLLSRASSFHVSPQVPALAMVTNVGFAVPRKEAVLMSCYGSSQRFGALDREGRLDTLNCRSFPLLLHLFKFPLRLIVWS